MDDPKSKKSNSEAMVRNALEDNPTARRAFLKGSGLAALGVAVLPAVSSMPSAALAKEYKFEKLSETAGKTLVTMARDIFPHDKVPDDLYAAAIASYDAKIAEDAKLGPLLEEGVTQLNAAANSRHGKPYADVPGEGQRAALLYEIEQTPFFQKVRGDLIFGIYNNKDVWPLFGYEGPSYDKGGYLNRGFNNINWL